MLESTKKQIKTGLLVFFILFAFGVIIALVWIYGGKKKINTFINVKDEDENNKILN